uniref:Uncharacterized protein n=1 Tax=Maylandia zebra TaxID=106582 RepID=A0A3P9C1Z7_9CICH
FQIQLPKSCKVTAAKSTHTPYASHANIVCYVFAFRINTTSPTENLDLSFAHLDTEMSKSLPKFADLQNEKNPDTSV